MMSLVKIMVVHITLKLLEIKVVYLHSVMYILLKYIMTFLIAMLIFPSIIILISTIYVIKGNTEPLIIIVICCTICLGLGLVYGVSTRFAEPIEVPIKELSINMGDTITTIRYGEDIEHYNEPKEIEPINNSSFIFIEIKEYNVLDEYNGSTYRLIVM